MSPLKEINCGWKWLEANFNAVIRAVNERTLINGAGIDIVSLPAGSVISASPNAKSVASSAAATAPPVTVDGRWVTLDVMDANCNRSTLEFWVKTTGS